MVNYTLLSLNYLLISYVKWKNWSLILITNPIQIEPNIPLFYSKLVTYIQEFFLEFIYSRICMITKNLFFLGNELRICYMLCFCSLRDFNICFCDKWEILILYLQLNYNLYIFLWPMDLITIYPTNRGKQTPHQIT